MKSAKRIGKRKRIKRARSTGRFLPSGLATTGRRKRARKRRRRLGKEDRFRFFSKRTPGQVL